MKKFFAIAAATLVSLPAVAADPPTTWTVTCVWGGTAAGNAKTWTDAVGVRRSEGGFSFVSMKQGEILTSAGMNCWVQPNLPPRS